MSRILLAWELGLNLGHLARLLPVAQRLKADGHTVLVATRDIRAAAAVLGPAGIHFVQAPHLPQGIALAHRATGYADILLSQGWSDRAALWGLTQRWLNLIRLFKPDQLILDYSPTVMIPARIAQIPCLLVGNGFELPPDSDPLPPFPGFPWADAKRATQSERLCVRNANAVLGTSDAPPVSALRELSAGQTRLFATFPELDHYGERTEEQYIGPLLGKLNTARVGWPDGDGPRVFASLRPDTRHAQALLSALAAMSARTVCVATGFHPNQLEPFKRSQIRFSATAVDLHPLLDADLCITYGAEGTMLRMLMAGVPQMILPWHVETFMAAGRIAAAGLGDWVSTASDVPSIRRLIERLITNGVIRRRVQDFASYAPTVTREPPGLAVTQALERVPAHIVQLRSSSTSGALPRAASI